ncbi:mCG1035511, partial [Mus musculus]
SLETRSTQEPQGSGSAGAAGPLRARAFGRAALGDYRTPGVQSPEIKEKPRNPAQPGLLLVPLPTAKALLVNIQAAAGSSCTSSFPLPAKGEEPGMRVCVCVSGPRGPSAAPSITFTLVQVHPMGVGPAG